ncbi:type II and III secretion system protein family protein [Xinfangfangia sp. D13-10-4-6]|uniref:type II and III secretion system protein family protein n=1 Tax=Pseudogemmobacter hezensis TaxID=2737662 RepID=UPI00155222A8|nr:type II and III secretion system protein family protein [Pseudogemmobacter hezensis]NPD17289.1 type II and III secretion system protein family protein [Pseudogemmobacter hezensis]
MAGKGLAAVMSFFLAATNMAPAIAQEVWSAGRGGLSLNVSEAKFIKLEQPATAIFLSNPDVAEIDLQSARYLYIVGRNIGESNLFVLGENDEQILSTTISVGIDAARLASAAQSSISGGSVSVKTIEGAIFLSGRVRNIDDAETAADVVAALLGDGAIIVNRLEVEAASQVNLQVRIAEVSRTISEDLGLSLTSREPGQPRVSTRPGGVDLSVGAGSRNINLVLDALARNGLVTILSEPNLTARSGEAATFLAGGRIPYRNTDADGKITTTFESIGVELEFTPTVFDQNQIQLQINTRVRAVDEANSSEDGRALSERSATTTVELGSGQSFAIAGMFQADTAQSLSGIPGLVNLPILGALFRSSSFKKGETELVIIVTPYLVKPTSPDNLRTPVDEVKPASGAIEQLVTGQMSKTIRPGEKGQSKVRRGGFMLQ